MPKQVLVVDDERGTVADTLRRLLSGQRYAVSLLDRARALQGSRSAWPDYIVLNGRSAPHQTVELARQLQEQASGAKVIAVVPTVEAPNGQDDVGSLTQVSTEDELVAWLNGKAEGREPSLLRVGPVSLNTDTHLLDVGGERTILTPKQFKLLRLFMSRPGETLTRKQLMKEVWDTDYTGDTRTLDVHIHWVREKLGDVPGKPKYLQTVRKVGYRFTDPTDGSRSL
jgi:DNA-binding response OmpR family regulator